MKKAEPSQRSTFAPPECEELIPMLYCVFQRPSLSNFLVIVFTGQRRTVSALGEVPFSTLRLGGFTPGGGAVAAGSPVRIEVPPPYGPLMGILVLPGSVGPLDAPENEEHVLAT